MKRYTWIWIMLIALLSGCEDDFDRGGSNPGEGVTEGMITFRFSTEEAPVIVTRAGEAGQQESLENVLVMVFDKDGKLVNKAYQQLTVDNHSVNIYLTAVADQSIYALCNLPEGDETEDLIDNSPVTLTKLKAKYTTIRTPEGAYGGKHIMTGSLPLELTATGRLKKEYTIPVKRLTAQVNFNVSFEPYDPEDKFAVGEMFLYNIPMGSMLLDGGGSVDDAGSWGYRHPNERVVGFAGYLRRRLFVCRGR
ncbi:fimbrial protein [Parabacteroides distasonis]|nr:fimbrial protein [Parabacteroides distasonis]